MRRFLYQTLLAFTHHPLKALTLVNESELGDFVELVWKRRLHPEPQRDDEHF